MWSGELSRDGERRQKRDLHGLPIWRRHWLHCDAQVFVLHRSHAAVVLSIYSRLRVWALTASHHRAFYKLWYRKSYIMRKKISPFTLKIHYECIKPFKCNQIRRIWEGISSYAVYVYNFSRINFFKRPEGGLQLQPKHVAVNKQIKTDVVCDWCNTRSYDLLTPTGMLHL
jgi:hypothetical protein